MDKTNIVEKAAFILHKIIFGVIYHGAAVFLYKLQNTALKARSGVLSFLGYFVPVILLVWFFDINRKKNTWKPFGRISETVEIVIVLLTMLVMYLIFGIA